MRSAVRESRARGWGQPSCASNANVRLRPRPTHARLAEAGGGPGGTCGNCDVCLNPSQRIDATEEAQKILSAAFRSGERSGTAHLIDIVLLERPHQTRLGVAERRQAETPLRPRRPDRHRLPGPHRRQPAIRMLVRRILVAPLPVDAQEAVERRHRAVLRRGSAWRGCPMAALRLHCRPPGPRSHPERGSAHARAPETGAGRPLFQPLACARADVADIAARLQELRLFGPMAVTTALHLPG